MLIFLNFTECHLIKSLVNFLTPFMFMISTAKKIRFIIVSGHKEMSIGWGFPSSQVGIKNFRIDGKGLNRTERIEI